MADRRKLLGAAALTAAIAGGGVTGALLGAPDSSGAAPIVAATDDGTATDGDVVRGRVVFGGVDLGVAAAALGMTEDELDAALEEGRSIAEVAEARGVDVATVIDALVEAGVVDLRASLEERITALVDGDVPFAPGGRGPGLRGGLPGIGVALDAAAEALGMPEDELRDALRDGRTIAEIADERGVGTTTVVDALVAAATERLDQLVEDGRLDEERADELEAGLAERIEAAIDREWGPGPGWRGGGPGHRWDRGADDEGEDGEAEDGEAEDGAEQDAEAALARIAPLRARSA